MVIETEISPRFIPLNKDSISLIDAIETPHLPTSPSDHL